MPAWPLRAAISAAQTPPVQERRGFAYVSLLWGSCEWHWTLGMTLGTSLAARTRFQRYLLHTDDVPSAHLRILQKWWILIEVPYIFAHEELNLNSRFHDVFTKCHIFDPNLLPFDKVLFLDLDCLVLKDIDDVFSVDAPAAVPCTRTDSWDGDYEHGSRMHAGVPINAGVMLVRPNARVFELICEDVSRSDPRWHRASYTPEQTYLERLIDWRCLDLCYNLEPTCSAGVTPTRPWLAHDAKQVCIAHYSTCNKPWLQPHNGSIRLFPYGQDWKRRYLMDMLPLDVRRTLVANAQARANVMHGRWLSCFGRVILDLVSEALFGRFLGRKVVTFFSLFARTDVFDSPRIQETLAIFVMHCIRFRAWSPACGLLTCIWSNRSAFSKASRACIADLLLRAASSLQQD